MSTVSSITPLPAVIRRKLNELRWNVSTWFLADAFGRIGVATAAMVFASLAIDRYFRMDVPQRLFLLVVMIGVLAYLVVRKLVVPLRLRLADDSLCLHIERAHPELADALISAVQFSGGHDASRTGASPALLNAAIELGAARAREVAFVDVLDRPTRRRNLALGFGSVGVLVLACLAMPGTMALWAQRNLLLSQDNWPQDTYLTVTGLNEDGTLIVPRGDDMELRVEADPAGVIPEVVYIDYWIHGRRGRTTEQMVGVGEAAFRATFRNVLEPFEFRVRGHDAVSPLYQVQLVDRPALDRLTLYVTPPRYTGRDRRELPSGEGAYFVLAGSTLEIDGGATQPLQDAELLWAADSLGPIAIDPDDPRRFKAVVAPAALKTGTYGIAMTNTDGLRSKRPARFNVRVNEDQTPTVRARLEGVGDMITQRALLPMRTRITDDYAVTAVELVYEWGGGLDANIEQIEPRRRPVNEVADRLGADHIDEFEYILDVEQTGVPLNAHLTFTLEATNNDAIGGPKVGKSTTFSLKVVSPEDLRSELLRREAEQRVEFERLIKDQVNLATETSILRDRPDLPDPLDNATWRTMSDLEKTQRLAAGRSQAIADQFARILAEVQNNRLEEPGGPLQQRLQRKIIGPLEALASERVPAAADLLDRARRTDVAADPRHTLLIEAVEQQAAIKAEMDQILQAMVEMEGYQQAINLLREIISAQKDLNEQTRRELEQRIEDIFDD